MHVTLTTKRERARMDWKLNWANTWILMKWWESWREIIFVKLRTYHLPPPSSSSLSLHGGFTVIVTGCTSGIGLHVAKGLAVAGARVIMACNDIKAAEKIADMWREEVLNSTILNVEVMELDLLSFSSVRSFAEQWNRRALPLHVLINNAGILKIRESQQFTSEGIEEHIHVNHVATSLLTLLLLPSLLKTPSSRLLHVNSVAHHIGISDPEYWTSRRKENFVSTEAYGTSKLAQIMFLRALARKLSDQSKTCPQCIAVHPGAVCTNLNESAKKKLFFMFDGYEGARSTIFCATNDGVVDELVDGFAYYSCTCKPGKMSTKAEDMDACFKVWRKTLEILDLNDDYLLEVLGK